MNQIIQGTTGEWEIVIGMEVHAQVNSNAKLFSGASTKFGGAPNSHVSFVDAGFPGMLPVINKFCVEQAILTGLGLNAQINLTSYFDRKNYFYADLPLGYQISQFQRPIVGTGYLDINIADGNGGVRVKRIGITRLHLEQDAGKSMHDQHPTKSYIDLNRAGVALMEIVSEPDIRSSEEAAAYVKKLRGLLRYLGTCDGNMEEGSLRADVNVSVRRVGSTHYGTRCEIKNVNSVKFIGQAIEYEANRQVNLLEAGGQVIQETRLFDANLGETRSMRSKENAYDYRYFPDPDLPPLVVSEETVALIKSRMPELPDARAARYQQQYGLVAYDADLITAEREVAEYYEAAVRALGQYEGNAPKLVANWLIGEVFAALNRTNESFEAVKITAEQLAELVQLITSGQISGKIAKDVFAEVWVSGHSPAQVVKQKGLTQITDPKQIEEIVQQVLADNPEMFAQYKAGKDKLFGYFVGQIMKKTNGMVSPELTNQILKQVLDRS